MLLSSWLAPLRKGFIRTLVRKPRPKRAFRPQRISARMAFETLEERSLLSGPDIVGIAPNVGIVAGGSPFLANGQLLNESPQNLTFTFSPSPVGNIDSSTLSGIQIKSAGPDGSLGTADDATVVPGYIDSGSNPNNIALYEGVAANQVVERFSNTLEAGWYRITLDGAVLKGTDGTSFQHTDSSGATSSTYTLDFQIDPGPQVSSVVPQPVLRDKQFTVNGPIANITDGDTVTISAGGNPLVFEFDRTGALTNASHIAVPYNPTTDTPHSVAVTFANVLNSTTVPGFGGQTPASRLGIAAPTAPPATGAGAIPRSFTLQGNAYTPVISVSTVRSGVVAVSDGALQQHSDLVQVYFNSNSAYNLLNPASASNPAYYQLIDTANGSIRLPQTVTYNQATNSALLQFSAPLPTDVTFHLRVGVSQANQTLATALNVGTLFNSVTGTSGSFPLSPVANSGDYVTTGFIGTSIPAASSGTPDLNDDFHLYKFNVASNGTDIRVITTPSGANLTQLRLFSANGTQLFSHLGNDTNAAAPAWNVNAGTYYLGVSSQGNSTYSPIDGRVVGGAGTWSGTYGLTIRVSDVATAVLDTSSFGTATNLGSIGAAGQSINSQINPISVVRPTATLPPLPGSVDEPGHRDIPLGPADPLGQNESGATRVGTGLYTPGQIPTFNYNFQLNYGYVNGVAQVNQITATQRQRAREIFDLYGNYLGIKFVETANQGLTVATGDIHVVSPASNAGAIGGIFGSPYNAAGVPDGSKTDAIMNASIDFGTSEYGGSWFDIAFHEIGHALGLAHSFDVPSVMGGIAPGDAGSGIEAVYPGDYNLVNAQSLNGLGAPNGTDINLYRFNVDQAGTFSAETIAQRLASTSLLDSVLTLYGSTYTQASAVTDFATGGAVSVTFTAGPNQPGALGNQVVLNFQKVALGVTAGVRNAPTISVVGSTITIRLNTSGGGTTALELVNAINNSQLASALVSASATGTTSTSLSGTTLTTLPLSGGTTTASRQVIARNDDYYGRDSFLNLHLTPGVYYLGVSSTGNTNYDPTVADSGFGGRTDGVYSLQMKFTADLLPGDTLVDSVANPATGRAVELDGDHDGQPGGAFDFWFQTADVTTSASTNNTIYVDKNNSGTGTTQDGTIAHPYNTIFAAMAQAAARVAANPAGTNVIVRIAGNGGADGDPGTLTDDRAYLLGFDSAGQAVQDGSTLQVPQGVTVMIDAGAVFKTRSAIINVGSSQGNTFSGGALQVLGTPFSKVTFTSLANDGVGGHSDPPVFSGARPGDWGGLVFRQDSDAQFLDSTGKPVFLNSVNQANITYGGGQVSDGSVLQVFDPVHMVTSRPSIWFNTITNSADSALSADPNSFDNSLGRIGPDVHGNTITGNTINGFFIRTSTLLGQAPVTLQVPARLAATDVSYVLGDNLLIAGAPGGPIGPQGRIAGSLVIDPGVIIKMASSRIETLIGGSQVIAEGTAAQPIVFTSLSDDTYGSGGTFDTSNNGATNGSAGDWGGFFFNAVTKGSLDHVVIAYGGGTTPIEGGFARFSAVQAQQAQLRLANSNLFSNSDGADSSSRNGRLSSADSSGIGATVFIRGGQPVLVNNLLENNAGHAISINANSLNSQYLNDWGRSTASPDSNTVFAFNQFVSNQGPLVRLNVLVNNATNGMEVRGEIITTQTVWDDTDIVHVVRDQIRDVNNLHTYGGIRLQSSADASLVVKLLTSAGSTAGFVANGVPLDISDRVGGTIQIVGTAQHPVVLTSLNDNTVGAGLLPNGQPQNATNNNADSGTARAGGTNTITLRAGASSATSFYNSDTIRIISGTGAGQTRTITAYNGVTKVATVNTNWTTAPDSTSVYSLASTGTAGDWGSILLDEYSNDTNVAVAVESEPIIADVNATPSTAQFLGNLAPDHISGNDDQRLGFEIHGSIQNPSDVDVYSFKANSGTEAWFDLGRTSFSLDTIVDVLDANGNILAGLQNSAGAKVTRGAYTLPYNKDAALAGNNLPYGPGQYYSSNPNDFAFRVVLPTLGTAPGSSNTYFVRVRSNAALTQGNYQLQIRTHQSYDNPGSTITYSNIRFATTGIQVQGLPAHSPLVGTASTTQVVENGTAQGSTAANNIQLRAGAPAVNGVFNGDQIQIVSGTGAGQTRTISAYNGATTTATVSSAWTTRPDNTSVYAISGVLTTTFANPLDMGNLLESDSSNLSAAGNLTAGDQVDWYRFDLNYNLIEAIGGTNGGAKSFPTIFHVGYADGLSRANTTISVFDNTGTLIFVGRDSDIADENTSFGAHDPYIGSAELPTGVPGGGTNPTMTYYVAISSSDQLPTALDATFNNAGFRASQIGGPGLGSANPLVRLEPITTVRRVVEDHIGFTGFTSGDTTIANGTLDVLPNTPAILPIDTVAELQTVVTPFKLSDVVMYVYDQGDLLATNPQRGSNRALGGFTFDISPLLSGMPASDGDITMRSDGRLFAYGSDVTASFAANAGLFSEMNTATGVTTATPTGDLLSDMTLPTTSVGALAYSSRFALPDIRGDFYQLFFAIDDQRTNGPGAPSGGNSILYRANPNTGDTTPPTAVGQPPWGPRNSSGTGISGVGGFTRGMAFLNGTLYGVSSGNQLFRIDTFTGAATVIASVPTVGGGTLSGLTLAPQNAYDDSGTTQGFYRNYLFAIDSNGVVYCLDPALGGGSVLKTAFDTNNDGVSDSTSISTGVNGASGLAFSPLDFNLWHPTLNQTNTQGHGINVAPDNSRIDPNNAPQGGAGGITYPTPGSSLQINQDEGGASFAFNLEPSANSVNFNDYIRYNGAQYGVSSTVQSDLTANTTTIFAPATGGIGSRSAPTYNLPGGAYGSLITQSFDLSTYSASDKPTLYFNYFLDTDGGSGVDQSPGNLMTDSARVFASNDNGVTWVQLASNNPQLSPFSPTATSHAELPAFISDSKDADVTDTRQAIQPLFNSSTTNQEWRQARVDLAQFAGTGNSAVKLRFDFSTAGTMNWQNQSTAVNPSRAALPGDATGDFYHSFVGTTRRFTNNNHQGFYVDDIIVGLAERGEMVTNAPTGVTTFTQVPQNPNPQAPVPTLTGPYQLEIRRGTGGVAQTISQSVPGIIISSPYDSNARLNNQTIITDDFSSGTFSALPWLSTSTGSGGAWSVSAAAPFPRYSAQAGALSANETSTLSLSLDTLSGPGQVVGFDVSLSSTTADTNHAQLRFLIDGVAQTFSLSQFSAARGGGTTTLRGNVPFTHVQFTIPAGGGVHTFQWVYSKDPSASSSPQDTAYIAHVSVPSLTSAIGSRALGDVGDRTPERPQGHVLISNNSISFAAQSGIEVTAGARDQFAGSHPGPVQNLGVLNASRLIPGVEIVSNVIDNFGTSGITVAGDANGNGAIGPVPYARVLNNTIYGGNTPRGTGILVQDNSSPTLLNNIVANTVRGVDVDLTSVSTVLGWMFFKGNTNNARIGSTVFGPAVAPGSNGIAETNAAAPLFVSPSTGNFYLRGRTNGLSNQAVDSALDTLADRPAITVVQATLGIPQSPIISPNTDRFGQLRVNDPSQPPSGGAGSSIFKDRGAIERADFTSPTARLFVPLDNQSGIDFDTAADVVALSNPALLTTLTLQLDDVGIGLDDSLVQTGQFRLDRTFLNTSTGAATTQTLVDGTDYVFSYNSNTHRISFTSSSVFATNSVYTITILGANTIPAAIPRISDLAGNLLLGNVANGDDVFRIVVSDGVNHAPVNSLNGTALTAGATLTATEDQGFVLNQANGNALSVSDQDAFLGTNQVITTLTVAHGTWSFAGTVPAALNVVVSPDGRTLTLTGTIPDINTAFRTGNLTYTPDANFFGVTGLAGFPPDTITMTTNDQGNFAVPAQPATQASNVITLNVAQVNDAPVLTFTGTSPLVLTEIESGTLVNRTLTFSYNTGALETNQHITGITFAATTTSVRNHTVNLPNPIAVDAANNPLVFPTTGFSGTGFIRVTLPAELAGTVVVAATITDDGTGGAANTRTIANFFNITVNPVNEPPTNNSTLAAPLRGTEEGAAYRVVYSELLAQSGAADEEGDPIYFRITSVNSGTLTLNGVAITNPVPPNTFYRSTDTLIWTPAPGDAGLGAAAPDAFTVQAFSDLTAAGDPEGAGGGGSGIDLHVTINVGHLPTLTTIDTIPNGHKNIPISISYATLLAASDAADADNAGNPPTDTTTGIPLSFRVIAVSSGTLSVAPGSLIQPGQTVTWTPPTNTIGTVPAFTVRAFDGVGLSVPPAVQVNVSMGNDLPTLSNATLTDPSYREDLPSSITFATLAAAVGLADANSDTLVLRIETVATGSTLTKGGVNVTPGVTTIGAGETIVWTGPLNAFGTLPAFSVRAFDGTAYSTNTAQISINTAFVNDPPTLTTINPFSSTTVGAPFTISYAALLAASNLADVDAANAPPAGQTLRFRIQTVANVGTLTKGGVAVSPGVTLLGPGESVVWTPGVQASGTKTAFTVVASDGTDVSSPNVPVQIVVANTAPVLTTISTLNGGTEDVAYSIPYSLLRSSSNASDLNGDPVSFRITAVAAGATLLKNGAAAPAGTIVSSGDTLSWRGPANAYGLLNAFSVRAFDGQTTSATDVQVRVNVAFVNDRPTLTAISKFTGGTSNLPYTISYNDLLAKSDLADVDALSANQTLSFLVQSVTEGTLTLNGVAVIPGNTLITPGDEVVYTPSAAASGTENAFTVTGFDATSLTAPGALSSVTPITVKVDVSTMQLTRLFRAYNPNANYHFFTTSLVEFDNAVGHGYHDETTGKPGFDINPVQYPGEDPLFRLRNPNTGLHYYTPSQGERDILVGIGWTFEKIEGFIFQTQVQGSTQIYKLYNTQTGTHLYTESAAQNDAILAQFPGIWVTNTPLGYAYAVPASSSHAPNYGSNVPLQQPASAQPVRSSVFAAPQTAQENTAGATGGDAIGRMGATSGTIAAAPLQPGLNTDGVGGIDTDAGTTQSAGGDTDTDNQEDLDAFWSSMSQSLTGAEDSAFESVL